jgi:large subunit ribosomal protein L10
MVSERKKQIVSELKQLVKDYPIIGVVNMQSLPAPQLQSLRTSLRGKVEIRMTRRRLLRMALEGSPSEKLGEHMEGMPALLFTRENPFALYRIIQKNKSSAPAKAGQVAPNDILIQAGPTPFAPGPVIGELGAIGLKTGVEGGKVAIKEDSVVCKKGEAIKGGVADVLRRLGVEPMEIGLHVTAVFENGTIFMADQLFIDEGAFKDKLLSGISSARNLAVECVYPANDIIELLVQKAHREAKAVAIDADIVSSEFIEELLGKGEREALALKGATNA